MPGAFGYIRAPALPTGPPGDGVVESLLFGTCRARRCRLRLQRSVSVLRAGGRWRCGGVVGHGWHPIVATRVFPTLLPSGVQAPTMRYATGPATADRGYSERHGRRTGLPGRGLVEGARRRPAGPAKNIQGIVATLLFNVDTASL